MKDHLKDLVVSSIGADYEVGAELGRGGMSVVYRALDLRLRREVAIKVLPPEFAYDAGIRERFRREAQMAAQLNHPHIIPIFSVDERDGVVYFAMALCEGESLAARLARTARAPLSEVRRILAEVADALSYAHAKGVVHRDIKPDNILIERDTGRAMVTDFGIARAAEGGARLTVTGIAMGTPAYMSPEQALGEHELDGRSDVYSLGAVAYQMLCGVTPFTAANTPSLLLKHVSELIIPVRERRSDVPQPLAAIVERALEKKRELRWQTAGEMCAALRQEHVLSDAGHPGAAAQREHIAEPKPRARANRSSGSNAQERAAAPRSAGAIPRRDAASAPDSRDLFEAWRRGQTGQVNARVRRLRRAVAFAALASFPAAILTAAVIGDGDAFPFWIMSLMPVVFSASFAKTQANWLRERGIGFWSAITAKKTVSYAFSRSRAGGNTAIPVPSETLDGHFGHFVWNAVQDQHEISAAIAKLPRGDRDLLPDVLPTVKALVERIFVITPTLTDLDRDVQLEDISRLERRIEQLEESGQLGSAAERTLQLLQRQHATLQDLIGRRDTLLAQVESASLLLQNIKLDLRKIGSAGLHSSVSDVNSATQEARALSREIGHVLSAAEDVRRL